MSNILMMVNIEMLEKKTSEFFEKFCKKEIVVPQWSKPWEFKDTLPNNDQKGCYAHVVGNEIVYIGLAIGNSFDGSGIGARVSRYWKKGIDYRNDNRIYESTKKDVTSIITFPFQPDNYCLAAALEVYLIVNLKPQRNRIHNLQ